MDSGEALRAHWRLVGDHCVQGGSGGGTEGGSSRCPVSPGVEALGIGPDLRGACGDAHRSGPQSSAGKPGSSHSPPSSPFSISSAASSRPNGELRSSSIGRLGNGGRSLSSSRERFKPEWGNRSVEESDSGEERAPRERPRQEDERGETSTEPRWRPSASSSTKGGLSEAGCAAPGAETPVGSSARLTSPCCAPGAETPVGSLHAVASPSRGRLPEDCVRGLSPSRPGACGPDSESGRERSADQCHYARCQLAAALGLHCVRP